MTQQGTNLVNTSKTGQVAAKPKQVDLLKGILNADSVQAQFKNALGKNASTFVASVIDLYGGDSNLQKCEPKQVVMEALKAAVLHLPINKALGYSFLIPYGNNRKDDKGNWIKVYEPVFQLGYKGYIQLAMRTGQYRTINADAVYEGELRKVNKLTGEIAFDGEKVSDNVVGYFCYFELLNGFSKTLYMTVDQIATHAKKYSKGLSKDVTVETLIGLAKMPVSTEGSSVGWVGNFHGMAIKTVIRNLLAKYGYLSIEMQNAIADDYAGESYELDAQDQTANSNPTVIDVSAVTFDDVSNSGNSAPSQDVDDPGY